MPRARSGSARHRKKVRVLRAVKGYRGARGTLYRTAKDAITRAGAFAYRDRRARKRDFRSLWITRLQGACQQRGILYSRFIYGLKAASIIVNRKMLSEVAIHDPECFDAIVEIAKAHRPGQAA